MLDFATPALTGRRADLVIVDDILPTTGRAGGEPLTMSSREIAELLGARHDNVKRTIERLAERSVISYPPTEEYRDTTGRRATEYRLDKRSSLIVVAQLSPEFTARVVDRWQELEAQLVASRPRLPDFTNPVLAARAWADEVELKLLAQQRVVELAPKAEALDVIASADGSFTLTATAKNLGVPPRHFINTLVRAGVLYRTGPLCDAVPMETHRKRGYFEVRIRQFPGGFARHQTMVTPKGVTWLAQQLGKLGLGASA